MAESYGAAAASDSDVRGRDMQLFHAVCSAFSHPSALAMGLKLLSKYVPLHTVPRTKKGSLRWVCEQLSRHLGSSPVLPVESSDGAMFKALLDTAPESGDQCVLDPVSVLGADVLGSNAVLFVVAPRPLVQCVINMIPPSLAYVRHDSPLPFWAILRTSMFRTDLENPTVAHHKARALTDQYLSWRAREYMMKRSDSAGERYQPSLPLTLAMWPGPGSLMRNTLPQIRIPYSLVRLFWDGDAFGFVQRVLDYSAGNIPYQQQTDVPAVAAVAMYCSIASQMARSIASLHRMRYVHCDVKLENVLVDSIVGPRGQMEKDTERTGAPPPLYPYAVLSDFDSVVPEWSPLHDSVKAQYLLLSAVYLGMDYDSLPRDEALDVHVLTAFICWALVDKSPAQNRVLYEGFKAQLDYVHRYLRTVMPSSGTWSNMANCAAQRAAGMAEALVALYGSCGAGRQFNAHFKGKTMPPASEEALRLVARGYVSTANRVGTPTTLPPEIADPRLRDEASVSDNWVPRTQQGDIWSWAMTLWMSMCATNRADYHVMYSNPSSFMRPPRESLLDHPDALHLYMILKKCLSLDPSERPTAAQIANDERLNAQASTAHNLLSPFVLEMEGKQPERVISKLRRKALQQHSSS